MTLSELCKKDVIQVPLGANLGRADDLRFDPQTAALEGLVLLGRPRLFGLLGRQEDVFLLKDGTRLPISRRRLREVQEAYSAFRFDRLRKDGVD